MASPPPPRSSLASTWWRPLLTLLFLGSGAALLLGLVALTAYRQGAFERQLQIDLQVPDAQGLQPGTRVSLSGLQVGVLRALEVRPDGRVQLRFTVPERYRGVISPASVVVIGQDVLMGDRQLQLQAAPAPPATVPDRFAVRYGGSDSLADLLRQASGSLRRLDALLLTVGRLSDGELMPTVRQLRRSLQRAEAVSGVLERDLPPTAAVLRGTARQATRTAAVLEAELPPTAAALRGTAGQATLASGELVQTLRQLRPQLRAALQQVNGSALEAQELLRWLNGLIDRLDPPRRSPAVPAAPSPAGPPPG